ncbi:MAG: DUF6498-containing protein [Gammaproteobacteria bacterium]|nr:DUF6498-containing protein [Gammaproteobacteria bacterium]
MPDGRADLKSLRIDNSLAISSVVLVVANLLPLYGVIALDWSVRSVILLFWLENFVIGVLNVLRILTATAHQVPIVMKMFTAAFFTVHYGGFWFGHGFFIFAMFEGAMAEGAPVTPADGMVASLRAEILDGWLLWPLIGIALSHAFSYVVNYLGRGEFRRTSARELMKQPYARVIVLHVTIIFGGLLIQTLNSPAPALVLLIAIKIAVDLGAHIREHRQRDPQPLMAD